MKKIFWTAADGILDAARLYRELARSAFTLLPSRRPVRQH